MIVRQHEVLDLLRGPGGSTAAAQAITGALLRDVEAVTPPGFEARASWVAVVSDGDAVDTIEWDPTTPIPTGALRLRCTAYTAALVSEDPQ